MTRPLALLAMAGIVVLDCAMSSTQAQETRPPAVAQVESTNLRTTDVALKKFYEERGIPMPSDLHIVAPAVNLPEDLRRFAGAHIGGFAFSNTAWGVVFEKIYEDGTADVVCANGSSSRSIPRAVRIKLRFEGGRFWDQNFQFWFEGAVMKSEYTPRARGWDMGNVGEFTKVQ